MGVERLGKDLRVNRSRMAIAIGLIVPLLALSGCSDDAKPKIARPSDSSSPTGRRSPSGTPSIGPEATVRAWIVARNAALDNGDVRAVKELSASDCTTCSGLIDPIKKIYAAGGHFDTDGWRVVKAKQRDAKGLKTIVDTAISIAGGITVTEAGGKPHKYPAEKHIVVFRLTRDVGDWAIRFVGFLS
jgi:hypothetical protein